MLAMTAFSDTIDQFVTDWRLQGRTSTPATERFYRDLLALHADDVGNRDPSKTGRDDVKRTLTRWVHPNTQATRRAVLVSFYRWAVEEGLRSTNPAEQVRRPKRRRPRSVRLTQDETVAILNAVEGDLERRVVFIAALAGLRSADMRRLRGEDFARAGFVRVYGKGNVERFVPVPPELEPVAAEIRSTVDPDAYVIPAPRAHLWGQPPTLVRYVIHGAGIGVRVNPQMLRRAYGDYIAKPSGLRLAQYLMGHADPGTTDRHYIAPPTAQELADAVADVWVDPMPAIAGPQGASGDGGNRTRVRDPLASFHTWNRTSVLVLALALLRLRTAFTAQPEEKGA